MSEFDNVDKTRLEKLANDMYQEMEKGLSGKQSSLLMIPTYIHTLPNGNESGNFLALGMLITLGCTLIEPCAICKVSRF